MDFITLFIAVVLLVLAYQILLNKDEKFKRIEQMLKKIPGPPAYPIIGSTLRIILKPRFERFPAFIKMIKSYGPIVKVWVGSNPEVHLLHPDYIEKIMNSSVHIEKASVYRFLQPWLGMGLLTSKGSHWHSQRKLITPTFHFKILDEFMSTIVEKTNILINKLKEKANGKEFDIQPYITNCTLDIICETAMGTAIHAQEKTDHAEYINAISEVSHMTIERMVKPWQRNDFLYNVLGIWKEYKKKLEMLHDFSNKVIEERKSLKQQHDQKQFDTKNDEEIYFGKKKIAFLDLLLNASADGRKLNNIELREEVDTFMFEGHDTTTAGICWTLLLLGLHPDVQNRVYNELQEIFGDSDRLVAKNDLLQMKYLEQVIKESLRLYPSVPTIGRHLTEDVELGDFLVPAGIDVSLHIFAIHRMEEFFPNPEEFNPDRFLPENIVGRHPFAFIPFSAGPRNCIGQKFAMMEEKVILSSILRNFQVKTVAKREELIPLSDLVLRPHEAKMVFKVR